MFSDINNDGQVDENEIIQEEHYYPFGLRHEGYGRTITHGENDYQYNGKELNTDFGLDMYDYGARFYDASVGRWFAVDPLAEKATSLTPFRYGFNNPLSFIDPDGQFETKKEARKYRRKNKDLAWYNAPIRQNKDGSYYINKVEGITLDDGSHGAMYLTYEKETVINGDGEKQDLIVQGVRIGNKDVLGQKEKVNSSLWGLDKEYLYENTLRDGSTNETPQFSTGTAPVGPGRFKKILSAIKNWKRISEKFNNDKFRLPTRDKKGNKITYTKADIDKKPIQSQKDNGALRSGRRVLKGSDGRWWYTKDHYETFKQIKKLPRHPNN